MTSATFIKSPEMLKS